MSNHFLTDKIKHCFN